VEAIVEKWLQLTISVTRKAAVMVTASATRNWKEIRS